MGETQKARLTVNMGTSVNILFKAFKDVPSDSSNRSSGLQNMKGKGIGKCMVDRWN